MPTFNIINNCGNKETYAFIVISYPSGSTCTCYNSTMTMVASDTSGKAVFPVQGTGSWTAKATNGTSTKTAAVSVTSYGQSVKVTLSY